MQCQVCNTTLKAIDRQGIEIDHCPQCRGIRLDRIWEPGM
jgi:Zn-finger nucleic acid-binding protein